MIEDEVLLKPGSSGLLTPKQVPNGPCPLVLDTQGQLSFFFRICRCPFKGVVLCCVSQEAEFTFIVIR